MKQPTLLFLAGAMLLFACTGKKQAASSTVVSGAPGVPDITQQVKRLDELAGRMNVPSQFFDVPGGKTSVVTGKKGTVLFINPGDLETVDGGRPSEKIQVELKELSDQSDMVR